MSLLPLSFLLFFACQEPAPVRVEAPSAAVRTLDVASFKNAVLSGEVKTLVDVRTPGEYAGGHVPGAINIPLDQVERRAEEIPEGEVFVICETGGRSGRAAALLSKPPLSKPGRTLVNVEGGTYAWRNAGYPME